MKDVFITLVLVCVLFYISGIKIEFNPFTISFESWRSFVALILFAFAIGFFKAEVQRKTKIEYKEELNEMLEDAVEGYKIKIK
ncbi:hypothetical protein [Seonamhaeicola sp.]|uniref:hypothetical protein n=1 Tax=Seonamhaeicola sp. TaxID=1912245 RepID=UPI0035659DAE